MKAQILGLVLFGTIAIAACAWLLQWRFTDDWKLAFRKWSTWFAGLNAVLWAHITATSGSLLGFVGFVPKSWQIPMAVAVFVIGWIIPVLVAHIKQQKLQERRNAANSNQPNT